MSSHEMMRAMTACNAIWRQATTSLDAAIDAAERLWTAEDRLRRLLVEAGSDSDAAIYHLLDMRSAAADGETGIHHLWAADRAGHLAYLCAAEVAAEVGRGRRRMRWTAHRRAAADGLRLALLAADADPADAARTVRRLVRRYKAEARRGWEQGGAA